MNDSYPVGHLWLTVGLIGLLCTVHPLYAQEGWIVEPSGDAKADLRVDSDGSVQLTVTGQVFVYREIAVNGRLTIHVTEATGELEKATLGVQVWQQPAGAAPVFYRNRYFLDRQPLPVWMRVERRGEGLAFTRGRDGNLWMQEAVFSRPIDPQAPVRIGFHVQSDSEVKLTIARADVEENHPALYTTSWVANSLRGPAHDTVNFNMTSMWTSPNGTCYVTSFFEEQGHHIGMFRNGKDVGEGRRLPAARRGIAGNDKYLFASDKLGFRRYKLDGTGGSGPHPVDQYDNDKGELLRGMAATNAELFVANTRASKIEVFDAETLKRLREWPFERPGAMAMDRKNRLWVVREGWRENVFEQPYAEAGKVVCVDPADGRELTAIQAEVHVPNALVADNRGPDGAARLLVADNGPDQQIKIFDVSGEPRLIGRIGARGGIMHGKPGEITDAKLNGPTGVGVDAQGNIYVSTTGWPGLYTPSGLMANAVRLHSFPPAAIDDQTVKVNWAIDSLGYIFDGGTLDPKDLTRLYVGADQIYQMDWQAPRDRPAGTYTAFTLNMRDFREEAMGRRTRCAPVVRRIDGQRFLFLQTGETLAIYRFDPDLAGETAIPAVVIRPRAQRDKPEPWPEQAPVSTSDGWVWWIWTDGYNNNPRDGIAQQDEYVLMKTDNQAFGRAFWNVLPNGDIWYTGWYDNDLNHMPLQGIVNGVPHYATPKRMPAPEPFTKVQWTRYDPATDVMVLIGATRERPGTWIQWMTEAVRYENWSTEPKATTRITFPNILAGRWDDRVMGFDVHGDVLYTTNRVGAILAYDLLKGNGIMSFTAGPEVNGTGGYFDRYESAVQGFTLPGGEQLVIAQENGWGKLLLYRWRTENLRDLPPTSIGPSLLASPDGGKIHLRVIETPFSGIINGYRIQRADSEKGPFGVVAELVPQNTWTDTTAADSKSHWYRVAVVNDRGVGTFGPAVMAAASVPAATFVEGDDTTLGNWRDRYGKLGYLIISDNSKNNPKHPAGMLFNQDVFRNPSGPDEKADAKPDVYPQRADGEVGRIVPPVGIGGTYQYTHPRQRHTVEVLDGKPRRITLYFAEVTDRQIGSKFRVTSRHDGRVLDERTVGPIKRGYHITWDVRGAVVIDIEKLESAWSQKLLAVFVDSANE